jgi:hypothetical protein
MGNEKFIRCCVCSAIHHVTPFDKAPIYARLENTLEERAADDWRAFMERHAGHRLEPLKASGETLFPYGSPRDPMSVAYVEVTNGHDRYLVRRRRRSIQEPMSYELISGRLTEVGILVEVQENEIKKEMKNHFSWTPATCPTDDKIDVFVGFFKEVIKTLEPQDIPVSEYSYLDNAVSYGLLDDATVDLLMDKCAVCFLPGELKSLRRFVETHRSGCDVMTLVMRRRLTIDSVDCFTGSLELRLSRPLP